MKRHALAVLAYMVATFSTQATSHFVVNAEHYARVSYIRKETIFPLGILAMLIEGAILTFLYGSWRAQGGRAASMTFSWLAGALIVSYCAFAEAAKYSVPSVPSWIAVELGAGFVQYTAYGLLLGLVYDYRLGERESSGAGPMARGA